MSKESEQPKTEETQQKELNNAEEGLQPENVEAGDIFNPQQVIDMIAKNHNADIYLYSGDLERGGAEFFVNLAERKKQNDNAILIISTPGGDADAAYIIARYIKRMYEKFTLFVFGYCKSAGTLLALGADEIVMSCRGEFGPLDVQIAKADEIGFRSSGLDLSQALNSVSGHAFEIFERQFLEIKNRSAGVITTKTAGEIAANITVGLMSPITSQIDPLRLGEIQRAINIAYEYGVRLSDTEERVQQLINNYPSHSFVIDYDEAQKIFGNVRDQEKLEFLLELALVKSLKETRGQDCIRSPYTNGVIVACLNQEKQGDSDENESGKPEQEENSDNGDIELKQLNSNQGSFSIKTYKIGK
jgi:hypothetical protein